MPEGFESLVETTDTHALDAVQRPKTCVVLLALSRFSERQHRSALFAASAVPPSSSFERLGVGLVGDVG